MTHIMPEQGYIFFVSLHAFYFLLKLCLFNLHEIILRGNLLLTLKLPAVDDTEHEITYAHYKRKKL